MSQASIVLCCADINYCREHLEASVAEGCGRPESKLKPPKLLNPYGIPLALIFRQVTVALISFPQMIPRISYPPSGVYQEHALTFGWISNECP